MAIKISSQIIKLARLASNNPNENEANLAARKACKMLVEAVDKSKTAQPRPSNPYDYAPRYQWGFDDIFDDYFRQAHARRQEAKCSKCGGPRNSQRFEIPIGPKYCNKCQVEINEEKEKERQANLKEDLRKKQEERTRQTHREQYPGMYTWRCNKCELINSDLNIFCQRCGASQKSKTQKTFIICKECRTPTETIYVGPPDTFICNKCQWTAYEKNRV